MASFILLPLYRPDKKEHQYTVQGLDLLGSHMTYSDVCMDIRHVLCIKARSLLYVFIL